MQEFLEKSRITANVEVVFKTTGEINAISKSSKDADLVFLGMKTDEDGRVSCATYSSMMEEVSDLPNTVLALNSGEAEFKDIFD